MLPSGQSRKVKEQIVDMAINGSGIRDTARVLHVSTSTVIKELKKETTTITSKFITVKATGVRISCSRYLSSESKRNRETERI
jgi:transposase-like protein